MNKSSFLILTIFVVRVFFKKLNATELLWCTHLFSTPCIYVLFINISDDCIFNIRCLNETLLAFNFISKTLVVVIKLNSKDEASIRDIKDIQVKSLLTGKNQLHSYPKIRSLQKKEFSYDCKTLNNIISRVLWKKKHFFFHEK